MNWTIALDLAKKDQEKFVTRGERIVKRYRDEREQAFDNSAEKKYNILWSNIRTLFPAVYAKPPQAQVERRYKDADPAARCASEIIERALQYEIDHYPDYDAALQGAVLDRLLPGRGVAWIRFEAGDQITDDVQGQRKLECTPTDYVFWKDFRHSPARTWEEVTWVARRVYMTDEEGKARFGNKWVNIPLTHEPVGLDDTVASADAESMKKAQIWEIWDKPSKTVSWKAEGVSDVLDKRPDPYGLDGFFPCPKPLLATTSTDTLIPVADYLEYQDQAIELDELTQRIGMLTKAVKVVGVYDASQENIQRMLQEGTDNTLIPVSTWAAFGEKGGLKGTVDFLPLDMVIQALNELYKAREACKQVIYEVTGLSDIIRGASVASETATAQQIKSQYASLRLKEMQKDVARFATDLLRMKAQIMCDLYAPETLIEMSGIQLTGDEALIPQAMELIKNESLRNYRIEIATDSMVELDEAEEKQARTEYITAVGTFLKESVQAPPELRPVLGEMLMFLSRAFKAGRPVEAALEQALAQMNQPKPPQPSAEEQKLQAETQLEQQRMQAEQQAEAQRMQMEQQREIARAQADMAIEQARMQMEATFEERRIAMEAAAQERQAAIDAQMAQMQMALEEFKAIKQAETQITTAQISAQATLTAAQESAADDAAKD